MRNILNNFIYRFKYNYGRYLNLETPIDVTLELSSFCNAKCAYCYHADKKIKFKKGHMPKQIALKILRQARELQVPSVKFNFKGESTLNPYYSEILLEAKKLSTDYIFQDRIVNSNFGFIKNKDEILNALTTVSKVKVSLDSLTKEVYEQQRPGILHEVVLKNIDDFYALKKHDKNNILIIQAVRTQLNKDEDLKTLIKSRWPKALISIRDMVGGRCESDLTNLEVKSREFKKRIPCKQAFARLIFDYEGNATMCCPDIENNLCLGNVNERHLYGLFNSDKAIKIRKDILNGLAFLYSPCNNCSSFESYGGYKGSWKS